MAKAVREKVEEQERERRLRDERRRAALEPMPEGVRLALIAIAECLREDGHDGLRVISSLVDANGDPEDAERVAIGARVEVEFADLGDGLGLPRFVLSDEPPEGELWRYEG